MKKEQISNDVAPGQISIFDDVQKYGNVACATCDVFIPNETQHVETCGGETPKARFFGETKIK